MNKGLQMATGDYVCFLNAGDSLPADDTIAELVANTGVDSYVAADGGEDALPAVLYGNTDIVDGNRQFLAHRRLSLQRSLRGGRSATACSYAIRRFTPAPTSPSTRPSI